MTTGMTDPGYGDTGKPGGALLQRATGTGQGILDEKGDLMP